MIHGFIQPSIDGFSHQLGNFDDKIGNYDLGLSDEEIASTTKDRKYLAWEINTRNVYTIFSLSYTAFEQELYNGSDTGIVAVPPPLPTVATAPTAVHAGMRTRFSNIADKCKRSENFTDAIGRDLDIVEIVVPFIPHDGKPDVKHTLHAGYPYFKYVKGKYQGAQIYKDSGDGNGFVKFDKAITSEYLDTTPLPASGVAVLWKYKFIYIYGGIEVGTASDVIDVMVKGL